MVKAGWIAVQDAARLQQGETARRIGFAQQQCKFAVDALASDAAEHRQRGLDQFGGARLDAEAEPPLEAHGAQDARRVIDEAQAVQHADQSGAQVRQAAVIVDHSPACRTQLDGKGVDGEVASSQVELDRAAVDRRQRGGMLVKLVAGGGEIDVFRQIAAVEGDSTEQPLRRAEWTVKVDHPPVARLEAFGEANGVGFDHEVDVVVGALKQQVAHAAADHVERHALFLRLLRDHLDQLSGGAAEHCLDLGGIDAFSGDRRGGRVGLLPNTGSSRCG